MKMKKNAKKNFKKYQGLYTKENGSIPRGPNSFRVVFCFCRRTKWERKKRKTLHHWIRSVSTCKLASGNQSGFKFHWIEMDHAEKYANPLLCSTNRKTGKGPWTCYKTNRLFLSREYLVCVRKSVSVRGRGRREVSQSVSHSVRESVWKKATL